jgi:hypothetical protein
VKKALKVTAIVFAVLVAGIQFIRPDRTNPPVDPALVLATPADVQAILDRSCADCHSSNTHWPWYSNIAPVSWRLADHVKEGRNELSFSEFGAYTPKKAAHKMEEVCEQVKKGEMPLKDYLLLHNGSRLSEADKQRLCEWSTSERARILTAGGIPAAAAPNAPAEEAGGREQEEGREH